ncbi:Rrf2 family transcriptional regulator [Mesorhizobium sp. WSM3860]|uniref:Rrf2 family transcriptional regulator n=1 Tax=Mesorhizobium sp. WSM3860 TaxID=2029403 RepID=UPI000BB05F4A|nr:Rrf2 family transcriptional regulator [Mesorhizobium sp. WSM3860]PBC05451.1 transcriptional regulator [Mesorhizobium sp. WSM3860]
MNTRFAVATHILTFLAYQAGEPATSELIASSVNTNPTFIRRLLTQLAKAGLSTSQLGAGGGALLARAPRDISLLDVYRAIDEEQQVFAIHEAPNPNCPVGRSIDVVLKGRMMDAERALQAQLATTTIADLAADIAKRNKAG